MLFLSSRQLQNQITIATLVISQVRIVLREAHTAGFFETKTIYRLNTL